MPRELERRLTEEAREKFPGDRERQRAYVYGYMRSLGWRPSRENPSREKKKDESSHAG